MGNIRSNNEDMILLADTFIRNTSVTTAIDTDVDKRFVIALADGMGGHLAGEVASIIRKTKCSKIPKRSVYN